MTHEKEKLLREQLHRLLDIAIDTNGFEARKRDTTGTLPTVFFEFSGHCNLLQFNIHSNGWKPGEYGEDLIECSLNEPFPEALLQDVEDTCKAALTDKKESEVLAKDIEAAETELKNKAASVKAMKKQLTRLRRKERSSTEVAATVEL